MSAYSFPLDELRPFTAADLYGFVLNGPQIVPAPGREADSNVLVEEVREHKLAMQRALKRIKAARDDRDRARALADVQKLKERLRVAYLNLQRWSIGYRFPGRELERWPRAS